MSREFGVFHLDICKEVRMKIGQAAKKFAVPVTSIYYYIKHGRRVPPVSRGQYVFDEEHPEVISNGC